MFTRKQYMSNEITHNEYYEQFASAEVVDLVRRHIGEKSIHASKDKHFNDIALSRWDNMAPFIRQMVGGTIRRANGKEAGVSLSDLVCTAKAAARIIKRGGSNYVIS